MRVKVKGESIFALAFLLVFLWFLFGSLGWPTGAKTFPLIISIPAALLTLWVFMQSLRGESGPEVEERGAPIPKEQARKLYLIMGSFVGMVALIVVFGLVIGVALFGAGFTAVVSRRNWITSLIAGVFGFLLVFGLFGDVLHFQLYGGLFGILGQ